MGFIFSFVRSHIGFVGREMINSFNKVATATMHMADLIFKDIQMRFGLLKSGGNQVQSLIYRVSVGGESPLLLKNNKLNGFVGRNL